MISSSAAYAVLPDEVMADPAKEARARNLSRELRCMVCQNESIDDSEAPLARDLRLLVRERIAAGDSDAQVLNFLVARYGEFVLLKPRLERQTLLLWLLTPFVLGSRCFGPLDKQPPPQSVGCGRSVARPIDGRGGDADQAIDVNGIRLGSADLRHGAASKPGRSSPLEPVADKLACLVQFEP